MRILIITYYWPPSGGGGVQRWLKLSRYLLEEGIQPIIYTPKLRYYPHRDDSLLKEIDPRIEIWTRPIWEPYTIFRHFLGAKQSAEMLQQEAFDQRNLGPLQRLSLWLRANFFIPDPKICWLRPSLSFLCRKLRTEPVDLVLSTGPPHSMHLIGLGLKKRLGISWWADFRDEWTRWDVLLSMKPSAPAWALHKRLERAVLRRCDKLLTVSKTWAAQFQEAGAAQTLTLYNGYDDADLFSSIKASSAASKNRRSKASSALEDRFQLLHLGQLSWSRSCGFWRALSDLGQRNEEFRSIEVLLGGAIDPAIHTLVEADAWLRARVQFCGYIPHESVFELYQEASLLLLFARPSPHMQGQIPGKLFEYLGSRKPILYMGDPKGEAAELIQKQEAGLCVEQNNEATITEALKKLHRGLSFTYQDPSLFSRKKQAETLAKALRRAQKKKS